MGSYWESLAEKSRQHSATEFEAVAYRLVSEQVLYYADRHNRNAYWMVQQYEKEFNEALSPLGVKVQVNHSLRYVYAIPRHAKACMASVGQTVMALVLRAIYDEGIRTGQANDDGEVLCDLSELEEKYKLLSGREMPTNKGQLDQLLDSMKRWGLAYRAADLGPINDDESEDAMIQPYSVVIRPGIVEVLGETALARLAQFNSPGYAADAADDEEENEE